MSEINAIKKFIINDENKTYCLFCYVYCYCNSTMKLTQEKFKSISSEGECFCKHEEHKYKEIISLVFSGKVSNEDDEKENNEKSSTHQRLISIAFNNLLMTEDKIFEKAYPEAIKYINNDKENLMSNCFRWEDVEVSTIESGRNILLVDVEQNSFLPQFHPLLNLAPIQQILTLNYIEKLMDNPNYYFGTPLYNRSLDYYTNILNFLIVHYLERDFSSLDKISAEEIETMSPITRIEIREKNRNNRYLMEKYFGTKESEFNIHRFALNVIDKFVPGASWRFIGGKHKCHFLSVKVSKILIEHGFLTDQEIEEVLNILYQKIPIFIRLEELIDLDSSKIDHKWIHIWKEGFMELREYFIEILIHLVYSKQDQEVLKMLSKLSESSHEKFTLKEAEKLISFQKTVLFEQEFGKKVLDFLLGYVLAQNKILGEFLTTEKVKTIAVNFLYIFSNTQDPFLQSLKLLDTKNIYFFLDKRKNSKTISPEIIDIERRLDTLINETGSGVFAFEEEKAVDILESLLDNLNQHFEGGNEEFKLKYRMDLNCSSILTKILNSSFVYSDVLNSSRKGVFEKLMKFSSNILLGNTQGHCMFFQKYNFDILRHFIKDFPQELATMMFEVMKLNIDVAVIDAGQVEIVCDLLEKILTEIKSQPKERFFKSAIILLKTVQLFLDYKKYKQLTSIPDYDKQVAGILCKHQPLINKDLIFKKIQNGSFRDPSQADYVEFNFYIEYLVSFMASIYWRFTYESFVLMKSLFTLDDLLKLIVCSEDYFMYRNVFLEFLDILYMDPKNELINKRNLLLNEGEAFNNEEKNSLDEEEKEGSEKDINLEKENKDEEEKEENKEENVENKKEEKRVEEHLKYGQELELDLPQEVRYWYDGEMFYDTDYQKIISFFILELKFMIKVYKEKDSSHYKYEDFQNYSRDQIMSSLLKISLYFSLIKSEESEKIAIFYEVLQKLETELLANEQILEEIFKESGQNEARRSSNNDPFLNESNKGKDKPLDQTQRERKNSMIGEIEMMSRKTVTFSTLAQRLKVKTTAFSIYKTIDSLLKNVTLHYVKSKRSPAKPYEERLHKTTTVIKSFSNNLSTRKEILDTVFETNEKMTMVQVLVRSYEKFKLEKLSTRIQENVYIAPLSNENNFENQRFCKNLCVFTLNQLNNDWAPDKLSYNYKIIECLCNCLFISTESMQKNLKFALEESNSGIVDMNVLDKIWYHMLELIDYVKNKTTIDRVWKENFHRALLFLKFHQYLCENISETFKNIFGKETLPLEKKNRVHMLVSLLKYLSNNFGWSKDYDEGCCDPIPLAQRPQILSLGIYIFDLLEELTSGPHKANQQIVFKFCYKEYRGILNRYSESIDSDFYQMKGSLINFLLALMEGKNDAIVDVSTRELELTMMEKVMINSVRHLVAIQLKKRNKLDKIDDITLSYKDFPELIYKYDSNPGFSNHLLLEIAVRIFSYIKMLSRIRIKYQSFCEEREIALQEFQEKGVWHRSTISEEALMIYDFLSNIVSKVEVIREGGRQLEELFFMVPSKCKYLSDESREKFEVAVERKSQDTKLIGLLNRVRFFNAEMEHMHLLFVNVSWFIKIFGAGGFVKVLQILLLISAFIINVLLLVDFQMKTLDQKEYPGRFANVNTGLASLNIVLSFIGLLFWMLTKFHLVKLIEKEEFKERHPEKVHLNKVDKLYLLFYRSFLRNSDAFVFIWHFVCHFLGIFVIDGFFGLALLTIVNNFSTLKILVRSATKSVKMLATTYLMALIIMYAYALFAHIFFLGGFDTLSSNEVMRQTLVGSRTTETKCDSLFHCFLSLMGSAFINGQGIGNIMKVESFSPTNFTFPLLFSFFYPRLIFEISFFLLINTILMNILMGIIIDTFKGQLELNKNKG